MSSTFEEIIENNSSKIRQVPFGKSTVDPATGDYVQVTFVRLVGLTNSVMINIFPLKLLAKLSKGILMPDSATILRVVDDYMTKEYPELQKIFEEIEQGKRQKGDPEVKKAVKKKIEIIKQFKDFMTKVVADKLNIPPRILKAYKFVIIDLLTPDLAKKVFNDIYSIEIEYKLYVHIVTEYILKNKIIEDILKTEYDIIDPPGFTFVVDDKETKSDDFDTLLEKLQSLAGDE